MDLLQEVKFILKEYNLSLEKSKGQNFLISETVRDKIVEIANLKNKENVLEIGPGIGILTRALLEKSVNLKSVELDENFVFILKKLKIVYKNFDFIRADILKINLQEFFDKNFLSNYQIISNIPYNITSRFLRIFLESNFAPKKMIVMLQKEVAKRIVNYDKKWSKLSVMCNFYSEPKIEFYVSRRDFFPSPDVDSAVISFSNISKNKYKVDEKVFFQIVNMGFSSKRRTLINNLSAGLKREKQEIEQIVRNLGFDKNIRAEKLNVEDWIKILSIIQH